MKRYSPFKSPVLWKDSCILAFIILGGVETVMSVMSVTLNCIGNIPERIGIVIVSYIILASIILCLKYRRAKNKITLTIRGINVTIKHGDILKEDGWKLIPFNEYFDTQVDDVIIAHSSLNGIYIDSLSDDFKNELNMAILQEDTSPFSKYHQDNGKIRYSLGTIKTFRGDVMMMALTHFNDQHEAHTNRAEYEHTLRLMWKEIGRVYAGKPIALPLIGAGLT